MYDRSMDLESQLLEDNDGLLTKEDIAVILANNEARESLEKGCYYDIYNSVEAFGRENADNEYREGNDYKSWGEFLLSTPGSCENIKLPDGKVFSLSK